MSTLLITPTAYFPPLPHFLQAIRSGSWRWEAHENYQKGGWRSRCRIAAANGPLLLTVPLEKGKHQQLPIREVRISYHDDWPRQHAQAIRSAYGRGPYFEHYWEELEAIITRGEESLWELNRSITRCICTQLDLSIDLQPTAEFMGGYAGAEDVAEDVPTYRQIFEERHGFLADLSVLDALFCVGPELSLLAHQR